MSLTLVCLPSTYLTTLMQDHYVCTGNMFLECVVDGGFNLNKRKATERYFQTFLEGEISLLVANRSQFFVI